MMSHLLGILEAPRVDHLTAEEFVGQFAFSKEERLWSSCFQLGLDTLGLRFNEFEDLLPYAELFEDPVGHLLLDLPPLLAKPPTANDRHLAGQQQAAAHGLEPPQFPAQLVALAGLCTPGFLFGAGHAHDA